MNYSDIPPEWPADQRIACFAAISAEKTSGDIMEFDAAGDGITRALITLAMLKRRNIYAFVSSESAAQACRQLSMKGLPITIVCTDTVQAGKRIGDMRACFCCVRWHGDYDRYLGFLQSAVLYGGFVAGEGAGENLQARRALDATALLARRETFRRERLPEAGLLPHVPSIAPERNGNSGLAEEAIEVAAGDLERVAWDELKARGEVLREHVFSQAERTRPAVRTLEHPEGDKAFLSLTTISDRAAVVCIDNTFILPYGVVSDRDLRTAYYCNVDNLNIAQVKDACRPPLPPFPRTRFNITYVKKAFPLISLWGGFWQHFIQDLADRLVFALPILRQHPDIVIICEQPRFKHFETIVRGRFGLKNPILQVPDSAENRLIPVAFKAEHAYLSQFFPENRIADMVPMANRWLREAFNISLPPRGERMNIIWISRRDRRGDFSRQIINEDEMISVLTRYCGIRNPAWKVVAFSPSEYSLEQAIDIFSHARAILSLHGGGNFNNLFAPPETVVIEFLPEDKFSCMNLSAGLGHEYWAHVVKGVRHKDREFTLPCDAALRMLDMSEALK